MTIQELERTTQVSAKTIRATYKILRTNLVHAIQHHPESFGGAGRWLIECADGPDADVLLPTISQSRFHRRHVRRLAPRLSCPTIAQELVLESAVRLLCALDLRAVAVEEDALRGKIAQGIIALKPRDRLQRVAEFVPGAKPRPHLSLRLYEDYRRYLLKTPFGTNKYLVPGTDATEAE